MKDLKEELEQLCTTALGYGNWLELDISSPEIQKKINEIVEKYELKVPKLRFNKVEENKTPIWEIIRYDGSVINDYYIMELENGKFTSDYLDEDVEVDTFEEICELVQQAYVKYCKEAFEEGL